ncbi:MAG: iron transporter [Opitutaceae bacterium]|nr:iron transporter [Opitutaceae bacterium]|tara:strand:- start:14238 stop:15599 length:1362 start_codon:yes stop_codon:yes gene_type:complete
MPKDSLNKNVNTAILEPPKNFGGMIRYWGPGLVMTAGVVGSGELIATTGLGAKTGFIALWLIILSCVIKVVVQLMLGRYAIYSGKTTLETFNDLPGPHYRASWFIWWWLLVLIMVLLQHGAMLGGVAMVLNILFPGVSVTYWAIIMMLFTITILRIGRYNLLQNAAAMMVLAFTITTIICVGLIQGTDYAISWKQISSGLTFDLPIGGFAVALAMFGITGVGAGELIYYPSVCLERGYAKVTGPFERTEAWLNRAKGWMRVMRLDAMLSLVVYTGLTIAFYLLGAAVLHARGLAPEGMDMIKNLSLMYTETLGEGSRIIFLIGAFVALYSTVFVSTATHARMSTDCFKLIGWIKVNNDDEKQKWIQRLVTIIPLFQLMLFVIFKAPLWMVVIGGTFQAISLIAIAFGALYLRYRMYIPELKPTRLFDICLWISGICIAIIAGYGMLAKLLYGS